MCSIIGTAEHRRRACVDPLEVVPVERTTTACRFKQSVTNVVRTPLSGDLAPALEASFDRVRATFGTKDAATVMGVVQGVLEARSMFLATRGVGAW